MILQNELLKKYYFGAYYFEETPDGYLQAFQYSKAQMEYFEGASEFWYERSIASSAKTLEFITKGTKISFDYKFAWIGSKDSFEASVNGLATQIYYVSDLQKEGRLTFEFPEGEKSVVIYLPADATVLIRNLETDAVLIVPQKKEKVLWLGDSITQGYGPLRSSCTYVSVANRIFNYDIINQGIGGYVYDKKSILPMEGYRPDKIIVSLGTNQYRSESMRSVEEFYETLIGIYGNEIPILCITPIWRGDSPENLPILVRYCENIKKIAGQYNNIKIVDGFTLVPHLSEYFIDNLHPNALGSEVYGRNLIKACEKLGF